MVGLGPIATWTWLCWGASFGISSIGNEMAALLGRDPHVVEIHATSDWLRFQIAHDGVLVYEATPGLWTQFKARAMVLYWDLAPTIALCAAGVKRRLLREAHHG